MKIKAEHYNELARLMRVGLVRVPSLQAYEAGHESIPRINLATDRAQRHRWDALYAAGANEVLVDIYKYANDSHIDTALRDIVKRIQP